MQEHVYKHGVMRDMSFEYMTGEFLSANICDDVMIHGVESDFNCLEL